MPNAETAAARIVSRDLSPAAADLAQREGWAAHARMHPATAAEYEARVIPTGDSDCQTCGHSAAYCEASPRGCCRVCRKRGHNIPTGEGQR